ncbi:MAG: hypothetical protein QM736_03370 [Vicinamibacterales bacterium]
MPALPKGNPADMPKPPSFAAATSGPTGSRSGRRAAEEHHRAGAGANW